MWGRVGGIILRGLTAIQLLTVMDAFLILITVTIG